VARVQIGRGRTSAGIISEAMLDDAHLSFRALGILTWLLDRERKTPVDNDGSLRAMAVDGREGRAAIRTALDELLAAGYVRRERRDGEWIVVVGTDDQDFGQGFDNRTVRSRRSSKMNDRDQELRRDGPNDEEIHREAHRLCVLAFERDDKPDVARPGKGGTFVAILALIERRLRSGIPSDVVERVVTSSDPIVWTLAGLQTAEAKQAGSERLTSATTSQSDVDAIMLLLFQWGRGRWGNAKATMTSEQASACERIGWANLCSMYEADARLALRAEFAAVSHG
jgi:hypothetical protein